MQGLCVFALLSTALAVTPTTLEDNSIGFRLNVLKNSGDMTKCPEKESDEYTVVSLIRTDKERARILNPYIVKLLMQCHVQEVHTWDLYQKEDGSGHLAGELPSFDDSVPEMAKLRSDWRERHVRTNLANFYNKYEVPDRKKAVLIKLEDSILYLDISGLAKATKYALKNPDNFLTIPNVVSDSTVYLHENCFPESFELDGKVRSDDELAAETHRFFLKDPGCFSLAQKEECAELENKPSLDAYLMPWQHLEEMSSLLQKHGGESKALLEGTDQKSCIHSGAIMASIAPTNKRSSEMYLPVYKQLSKKISAGSRLTDDGVIEEILSKNGLDKDLPKKVRMLLQQDLQATQEPVSCPRVRSFVDLGQCTTPEKKHMKWLQIKETVPDECRRPCTAAPLEIQGAQFVSEERRLALFSSAKLTKPMNEMFKNEALKIQPANPEATYEAKDYHVVVSAHEPLDTFAHTMTDLMKAMKQIGVDKRSLKQAIVNCKATPEDSGCKALLTEKLPVLEKFIDLEAFDHNSTQVTRSLIQSVFEDIKRVVYPGCEAQLGAGAAPQLAAFLPSYLQIQAKKPFHVIRDEYADEDLSELFDKLDMKVTSSLAEFGFSTESKGITEMESAAQDLQKDIQDAVSLLEQKNAGHETQSRDATIKAMQDIAMDADANVEASKDQEIIKSFIKEDAELSKAFCSIYSMDYSCLGYNEEFEKICGYLEGPDKVEMKPEFILKVSAPRMTLRQKTTSMRMIQQKSCLLTADSQISFIPFVNTVRNCQAHCESKSACQTYNYDQATFGCRLYGEKPVSAVADLHSTCGAMCKDNDEGVQRAMENRGLHSIGSSCAAAKDYCSQEDIALHCPMSCMQAGCVEDI